MKKKEIEIVITNTAGLNLMAPSTVESVHAGLSKTYQKVSITRIQKPHDLDQLLKKSPDLVFSGVKYLGFNKGKQASSKDQKLWLSEILNKHGINHTGSQTKALMMDVNKGQAKKMLQKKRIATADYFTAVPGQFKNRFQLPVKFPLFIKPNYEGAGRGIDENSIVKNFKQFKEKVFALYSQFNKPVLVEKYLPGREFTVGLMRNPQTKKLEALPVEIVPQKNSRGARILSEKDKQADLEKVVPIKEKKIFTTVARLAKKSFKALGARDYGRIDMRFDHQGKPHFLEANLVPGIGTGYFTRAYKIVKGKTHAQMINALAEIALRR